MGEYRLAHVASPMPIDYSPPSDKFWQDFPTGVVPIVETRHLMPIHCGDLYQGLLDTLTVFEFENKKLCDVTKRRSDAEFIRKQEYKAEWAKWVQDIRAAMADGENPYVIAQLLGIPEHAVPRAWQGSKVDYDTDWQSMWYYGQDHPNCAEVCAKFPDTHPSRVRFFLECSHIVRTRAEMKEQAEDLWLNSHRSMRYVQQLLKDDIVAAGWKPSMLVGWFQFLGRERPSRSKEVTQ